MVLLDIEELLEGICESRFSVGTLLPNVDVLRLVMATSPDAQGGILILSRVLRFEKPVAILLEWDRSQTGGLIVPRTLVGLHDGSEVKVGVVATRWATLFPSVLALYLVDKDGDLLIRVLVVVAKSGNDSMDILRLNSAVVHLLWILDLNLYNNCLSVNVEIKSLSS